MLEDTFPFCRVRRRVLFVDVPNGRSLQVSRVFVARDKTAVHVDRESHKIFSPSIVVVVVDRRIFARFKKIGVKLTRRLNLLLSI